VATKKFKFKVYFDKEEMKLCGGPLRDDKGVVLVGAQIMISDDEGRLPAINPPNPKVAMCDAELIVQLPSKKKKGEITLRK